MLSCSKNYISSYLIPNNAVFALFFVHSVIQFGYLSLHIATTLSYLHLSIKDYKHLRRDGPDTETQDYGYRALLSVDRIAIVQD